jgi:DNA invertase Pin-like site-specific DNA recombinase
MRAVIYARISKDREGAGLGVERQRTDCTALAERLGWEIVDVYTDNDISAYSGKHRPGYDAMCAALDAGKAQGLIVWHADRLHRRPIELESFIDLCDRRGIRVQTVQSGTVDLSTASGRMVARMLGAAARHEVDHMIERQKRAKKQAAIDGRYRGSRRSFGYEPDGKTLRDSEANAIRQAVDKVLFGVSLRQIAREWNQAGLRTSHSGREFNSRLVRSVLLRPRNAGFSLHEGARIPGAQWEPIIDTETFAAVEAILRDPDRSAHVSFERKYQGSGVYLCGKCGAKMVSGVARSNAAGSRPIYVCSTARHLARDVEHLDTFVDEIVLARLSRPDAAIVLGGTEAADIAGLQAKREGLRARLDELSAMFAEGSIDGPQLKRGTAELHRQLDGIDAQLAHARSASAMANLILAGDDLRATWAASPPGVRGAVIDALMTVTVLPTARGRKPGGRYFDPDSVRIDWRA